MDSFIDRHPELFPFGLHHSYQMKDIYLSKKLSIYIRRIKVTIEDRVVCYTIRPSFVMPYLTGMVVDVEKPLMLRKFSVPFWALSYCFGRDPMYWYRMETSLGRHSIVGTTVKSAVKLPQHLSADEKHTKIKEEKAYIPYPVTEFDFLGYTFRPRTVLNRKRNKLFISFTPAVSKKALTAMRQRIRKLNFRNRSELSLADISMVYNPILRGWLTYYGHFYKSAMYPVFRHFNKTLVAWAMRKYKKLKGHKIRVCRFLENIAKKEPHLFVHWQKGMVGAFS